MDNFSWVNLITQIPVVALFSWVILKIFFKVKEFVELLLTKNESFLGSILDGNKEERISRDTEWRKWLDSQKDFYVEALNNITAALNNLTSRIEEHHRISMSEAAKIIELLNQANLNRIQDKKIIEDEEKRND